MATSISRGQIDPIADEHIQTGDRDHGADHHDLAMREIDEAQNAVNHGVAERDQGINAAQNEAVNQLLYQDVQECPIPLLVLVCSCLCCRQTELATSAEGYAGMPPDSTKKRSGLAPPAHWPVAPPGTSLGHIIVLLGWCSGWSHVSRWRSGWSSGGSR
jgi:hypothetical protein